MANASSLVALLRSEFDESPWYGYIVARSEALLILHRVSDRFDLDGYCAFRCEDITNTVEDSERVELISRALRLNGQAPVAPRGLQIDSVRELMDSAQKEYEVLVVNRERVTPGEVEVGTIRMSTERSYVLRALDANAVWSLDDRTFRYEDVTCLEFGSTYETTLLRVAMEREGESAA